MGTMSTQQLERSAEALAAMRIFWGGVEHTTRGFEAFGTENGVLVSLGAWPTCWGQAADFYAQWSVTHPRQTRPQPSRAEMMAEIQRVRRHLDAQRDATSRAYELRGA
jgi:hypothetical protein